MRSFPWKYTLTSVIAFTLASVALAYLVEVIMHTLPGNHPPYSEALPTGLLFGLGLSIVIIAKQYEFIKTNEGKVTAENIYPKRKATFYVHGELTESKEYLKSIAGIEMNWQLKKEKKHKLLFIAKSDRGPSSIITLKLKPLDSKTEISCTITTGYALLPADYGHTHECLHKLEELLGEKLIAYAG